MANKQGSLGISTISGFANPPQKTHWKSKLASCGPGSKGFCICPAVVNKKGISA